MSTSSDPRPRAPRSQFLQKLHGLLEHPVDPTGLRWVTDDSFEVSSRDAVAIYALSPAFEFNSLSGFIRQLSYYSFRRLSDRRRSTERRCSNTGYILFTHPSGFFVRGDPSKLSQIARRPRGRPEKGRRISTTSSVASDEPPVAYEAPKVPQPPAWTTALDHQRPVHSAERTSVNLPSLSSSFASRLDCVRWRNYAPKTGAWLDPSRADAAERFSAAPRRSSLGDFKLSAPTSATGLAGVQEPHSPLCKETPWLNIQTRPDGQHALVQPDNCHGSFRPSPYPTPTFSPTSDTFFSSTYPPSQDYYAPTEPPWIPASHVQGRPPFAYEPSPFAPSYQPVAQDSIPRVYDSRSYRAPSPDASPLQSTSNLPAFANVETAAPRPIDAYAPPQSRACGFENQAEGDGSGGDGGAGYSHSSGMSSSTSRAYYPHQPAWSPVHVRHSSYV